MKRLPNVREVMTSVRASVAQVRSEKVAAEAPGANLSVDVAQDLMKVASEIRDGSFAPVTYNEVMKFASLVKEAVQK
ncbi:MAG: hypothetical protein DRP83_00010 [Planctomycetota bacterium]|nr:MAG: hypothetical protein DRP83_00010 [Planctomycetota bacterium]